MHQYQLSHTPFRCHPVRRREQENLTPKFTDRQLSPKVHASLFLGIVATGKWERLDGRVFSFSLL